MELQKNHAHINRQKKLVPYMKQRKKKIITMSVAIPYFIGGNVINCNPTNENGKYSRLY